MQRWDTLVQWQMPLREGGERNVERGSYCGCGNKSRAEMAGMQRGDTLVQWQKILREGGVRNERGSHQREWKGIGGGDGGDAQLEHTADDSG
jgi:hypothetical protein